MHTEMSVIFTFFFYSGEYKRAFCPGENGTRCKQKPAGMADVTIENKC